MLTLFFRVAGRLNNELFKMNTTMMHYGTTIFSLLTSELDETLNFKFRKDQAI